MSGSHCAAISKLPPELLFHTFLLLSDNLRLRDLLHICEVCKSWLPGAQSALYRSVTLSNDGIRNFARTIEENDSLAPLIKHLTLDRLERSSDWISVNKILQAISKHETLLSLHFHAILHFDPERPDTITLISPLSFLGHLDIDSYLFRDLHAMKLFIASFPRLHTLQIHDMLRGDFENQWYDGSGLRSSPDFPRTIRNLSYYLTGSRTREALLQWLPLHPSTPLPIHCFAVTVSYELNESLLNPLLRSFGTELTALTLDYRWPSRLPIFDLKANTNLRSLSLVLMLLDDQANHVKEHLSATLGSLALPFLQTVEFHLHLILPGSPQYDFVDWGVLDKAVGNADIRISVLCMDSTEVEGIKEGITRRMPQHRMQGKLQCVVRDVFS